MKILCVTILALNWLVLANSLSIEVPLIKVAHDVLDQLVMVQSPIAISMRDSKIEDKMPPLQFYGHWEEEGNATLTNTGHSAMVTFEDREEQPYITGGPLEEGQRYIFAQIHFHWAKRDKYGSEHVIDGQTHSMEAHLVHYNEKYGNFETALTKKDGVAVVAFFIQAFGDKKDESFAKITDHIKQIRNPGSQVAIDSDCLQWVASQELSRHYYTYHGSLTTAPFNECVTWIIFQGPMFVAKSQVGAFQTEYTIQVHIRFNHITIWKLEEIVDTKEVILRVPLSMTLWITFIKRNNLGLQLICIFLFTSSILRCY